jgi:hypothetical protein
MSSESSASGRRLAVVAGASSDLSHKPGRQDESVVAWLLKGDVAVQFQTWRDLLHRYDAGLQERIAHEGQGAAILNSCGRDGHWGRSFYLPKWTSSHYTLLELTNLGLSRLNRQAGNTVMLILKTEKGGDGGLNPTTTVKQSDVCVNGMALNYASYFGAEEEHLMSIVDFLLLNRMPDGGFNCRLNRFGVRHSSVHSTVCVLEGITEYQRSGYRYRLDELRSARAEATEFLLVHRLYRRERTGQVINPEFTRLHYPARWHFDILRGLDALADSGLAHDPRMDDAGRILEARRGADGRWAANRAYPGLTHIPPDRPGKPNRWISLIALRVLNAYAVPV